MKTRHKCTWHKVQWMIAKFSRCLAKNHYYTSPQFLLFLWNSTAVKAWLLSEDVLGLFMEHGVRIISAGVAFGHACLFIHLFSLQLHLNNTSLSQLLFTHRLYFLPCYIILMTLNVLFLMFFKYINCLENMMLYYSHKTSLANKSMVSHTDFYTYLIMS